MTSTVEQPAAETPPAETPPAETPPAETPPAETPTAELVRGSGQIQRLRDAGVSIWLDDLTRERLRTGELAQLVEAGITGVTTNRSY